MAIWQSLAFNVVDPWPDHPAREKVRFYAKDIGFVVGLLPEQFGFSYTNRYANVLDQILSRANTAFVAGQQIGSSLLDGTPKADYSLTIQELKQRTWRGGTALGMNVQLLYIARKLASLDVVRPIERLIEMTIGGVSGKGKIGGLSATMVKPPPVVQVEFGNVMRLRRVHIATCNWKYSSVVDPFGVPTIGIIDLTLETDRIFITNDLDNSFVHDQNSVAVPEGTPGLR